MAVRQYVGARYVPRFSTVNGGVWNNSYSYEALEIVKYGNDYYTSKKPVPTGVAITNTEYWVLTGNYNGAIATLDDKIDALSTSISASISNINSTLSKLYDLHDRVFILIGDSYGQGYTPNVSERKGWCFWIKKMIEACGGIALYSGTTGAGFATSGNQWITYLQNMQDEWSSYADRVTDVVFLGGSNDQSGNGVTTASLQQGISDTFAYVRSTYPHAKIYTGIVSAVYNQLASNNVGTINQYQEYAESLGAIYLGDLRLVATNPNFQSTDNVHLTQAGYEQISRHIFTCLMTGHCHFNYIYNSDNITLDTDMFASDAPSVYFSANITPNMVRITFREREGNGPAIFKLKSSAPQSSTLKNLFEQEMHVPVVEPNTCMGCGSLYSVKASDTNGVIYHGNVIFMPNSFYWGSTRIRVFYPRVVTNLHRNDDTYIPYISPHEIVYNVK